MSNSVVYKGFSSRDRVVGNFNLTGIDLVKQDLQNEFFTRKRERPMFPEFGFIGWDLLYEPFDEAIKEEIIVDAQRIVEKDPRVELQNTNVQSTESAIRVELDLFFLNPINVIDQLRLDFNENTR